MKDHDLTKALFDLIKSGDEPDIQHQPNDTTKVNMKLDKIKYIIKPQNL